MNNAFKVRLIWACLTVLLSIGFTKWLYPMPAQAAAEIINSTPGLTDLGNEAVAEAQRERLERAFRKEAIIGAAIISCGLFAGFILGQRRLESLQLIALSIFSVTFIALFCANNFEFFADESLFAQINERLDMMYTLMRVGRFSTKLLLAHDLLSITCVSGIFIFAVANLVKAQAKSPKP